MSQEWMIDVLTDLRKFAHKNGLLGLAEQLDDSILVAATELKSSKREPMRTNGVAEQNPSVSGTLATSDNI